MSSLPVCMACVRGCVVYMGGVGSAPDGSPGGSGKTVGVFGKVYRDIYIPTRNYFSSPPTKVTEGSRKTQAPKILRKPRKRLKAIVQGRPEVIKRSAHSRLRGGAICPIYRDAVWWSHTGLWPPQRRFNSCRPRHEVVNSHTSFSFIQAAARKKRLGISRSVWNDGRAILR